LFSQHWNQPSPEASAVAFQAMADKTAVKKSVFIRTTIRKKLVFCARFSVVPLPNPLLKSN
jgi:hypothetical protein